MRAYITIWTNSEESSADSRRGMLYAIRDVNGVVTADMFIGDDSITAIAEVDDFAMFNRIIEAVEAIPDANISAVGFARPY